LNKSERKNGFRNIKKMNVKLPENIIIPEVPDTDTDTDTETPTPTPTPTKTAPKAPRKGLGGFETVIMVVDKLIAIGEKFAPIVKAGKAVVKNNPMSPISVLPRTDLKDFAVYDMGQWSIPVSRHYKISYKNGWGAEVVSFVYSVSFQFNGRANGKGRYLTGVRASATSIVIGWGFDLDASSQLIQISNVGTQENVVAGATLEMTYTVKNWLSTITTAESFHLTGDGQFYKLD
jgi:hypothetical protein